MYTKPTGPQKPKDTARVRDLSWSKVYTPHLRVLWFSQQSRRDVANVCFFEGVLLAVIMVDAYEFESGDDAFEVEAHEDEAVDHVLVVAVVSVVLSATRVLP